MLNIYQCIVCFVIGFIISTLFTPIAAKIAVKVGAVDVPTDPRKVHKKPIPRLGGIAIFFGVVISFILTNAVFGTHFLLDGVSLIQAAGILCGATIIVIVGAVDDTKNIRASVKLVFQILAAVIVIYSGTRIQIITNPFSEVGVTSLSPYISIPLTVFWIVGVTNAINLIDGLDGLAAGICSIASISLLFISISHAQPFVSIAASAIAGATLGFLPYNFNPAKIFMGDTGATFLGFVLAAISIQGTFKAYTTVAIAVPFLVLGLPIFDTLFAIIRRMINGKSIMQADRGHIHHRLLDMGLSQKQSVVIMYTISSVLGLMAITLTGSTAVRIGVAVIALLVFIAAIIRHFISECIKNNNNNHGSVPKVQMDDDSLSNKAGNE